MSLYIVGYIISGICRFTKMIVHPGNNGHTRALPGVQRPSSPPTSPRNKESQWNSRGQHLAPQLTQLCPITPPSAACPTHPSTQLTHTGFGHTHTRGMSTAFRLVLAAI